MNSALISTNMIIDILSLAERKCPPIHMPCGQAGQLRFIHEQLEGNASEVVPELQQLVLQSCYPIKAQWLPSGQIMANYYNSETSIEDN